jgi:hypothetical protein
VNLFNSWAWTVIGIPQRKQALPQVLFLESVRYRGYVPQQTGYQETPILVVPRTLSQKHGFRNMSDYSTILYRCFKKGRHAIILNIFPIIVVYFSRWSRWSNKKFCSAQCGKAIFFIAIIPQVRKRISKYAIYNVFYKQKTNYPDKTFISSMSARLVLVLKFILRETHSL